jgi:hypothetical protein
MKLQSYFVLCVYYVHSYATLVVVAIPVGPKPRAHAVGDGWPVDIPALVISVTSNGGTRKEGSCAALVARVRREGGSAAANLCAR